MSDYRSRRRRQIRRYSNGTRCRNLVIILIMIVITIIIIIIIKHLSIAGFYRMSSLDKSKSSWTVGLSSVIAGTILVSNSTCSPDCSVPDWGSLYVSGMYLLGPSSCWTFTTCSVVLLSLNKNLVLWNEQVSYKSHNWLWLGDGIICGGGTRKM